MNLILQTSTQLASLGEGRFLLVKLMVTLRTLFPQGYLPEAYFNCDEISQSHFNISTKSFKPSLLLFTHFVLLWAGHSLLAVSPFSKKLIMNIY